MVRWLRWHCPPDTGFEIRALAIWGRARYPSVTEAPHNTDFHTWMGKKHFCFFQTAETGNLTPNSGVKGSGANHYPRAKGSGANHYPRAPALQAGNGKLSLIYYGSIIMVGLWCYNQSGVTELLIMRDSYHVRMCFKSVKTLRVIHS